MDNCKVKIMTFYLPQFHAIPENDAWWGEGFTDWTNVKKGVKFFEGQEQPRVPLNNNYYDLSDYNTLKWQADLMEKYGIYGQCIYHYWFDGKLLLEKPAELLLSHTEIKMNFCFSWANEPWARTWDGKNSTVLMPQRYGDKKDWKTHFDYLLPFFKDPRYIKVDNCPMFVLYKSSSIPNCEEMMNSWITWAIDNGFDGIHFVETLRGTDRDNRELPFKAQVEFEPARTDYSSSPLLLNYLRVRRRLIKAYNRCFNKQKPLNKPLSYSKVAQQSLKNLSPKGTYAGAFVGWDNTARKGLSGMVIFPPSVHEFEDYLKKKIEITQKVYGTDFVFINAWNEWAEGTYLEPDEIHRFLYLEVIKKLLG